MTPIALLAVLVACSGDAIPTSPEGPEQNRLVATVEVEPPYMQIGPDDLGSLDAVVKSARGRVVNGRTVHWRSSDPSVVRIEPDGRITGVNEGEAEIYAEVEGRRGSARVKVKGTVVGIELPEGILTSEGATKQVQAFFRYRNGARRPAGRVKWVSEDLTIATIDGDGLLRGRSTGSTLIVAFARGQTNKTDVQVSSSAVASIELSADSLELEPGETHQLWAEVLNANGDRLDKKVVWSSYDESVATVSDDGLVSAVAVGATQVEAKSGGETATAHVQVVAGSTDDGSTTTTSSTSSTPEQVTDLAVTGADDQSVTLTFTEVDDGTGAPADYLVRYSLPPIDWSSASDVSKGTCAGSVSGSSIGSSLSCTVEGLQASTSYEFQVVAYRGTLGSDAVFGPLSNVAAGSTDDPPVYVDVSPSYIELDEGQTGQLDAEVTDAYGNPVDGYTVTWGSSNTTVATVDQDGLVSGESAGDATITASVDEDSDDASASVQDTTSATSDDGSTRSAELRYSLSADRSSPLPLSGDTLAGSVYAFLATDSVGVDSVVFKLDGTRYSKQELWPYDFAGGSGDDPNPWDTNEVADGEHRIEATVFGSPGGSFAADFSVQNDAGSDSGSGGSTSSSGFDSPLVSFPGAEGWGAEALNSCRSLPGEVRFVTNLNDSGTGSFRDAVENSRGDRYTIVVFRTGGTIELTNSAVKVGDPCIYIAGQTAPGGGILLKQTVRANTIGIPENERVAIRYLRFRHTGAGSKGGSQGYVAVNRSSHVIIDHLSGSWTRDDGLSMWRSVWDNDPDQPPITNVTVQRSILAEGLADHSVGGMYGGTDSHNGHELVYYLSWHHNLFATNNQRNPSGSSSSAQETPGRGSEIINNVVYNWSSRVTGSNKNTVHDIVNNYYLHGPNGAEVITNMNRHLKTNPSTGEPYPDPSIYIEGNVAPKVSFSDQWELIRDWEDLGSTLPTRFRRSTRLPQPPFPVTVTSADAAWDDVLGDVGANARLDCQGGWLAAQDAVDERIIDYTLSDTGPDDPPLNPSDVGGFPTIASGTPCADADSDGMPDEWESLHGVSDPWGDRDGDGYWNLEEYLNGTTP